MRRIVFSLKRYFWIFIEILRALILFWRPRFWSSSELFWWRERRLKERHDNQMIDLVFAMDCTASMSSYIHSARDSIELIARRIESTNVRFGYVAYRDHPPQDLSFVTRCHDFMTTPSQMKQVISTYDACGGGDIPEAVTPALYESMNYPWRENAIKIVILIADAPPHGTGVGGDGFPLGDPSGRDPIEIANEMALKGIILHVVACEPTLSSHKNAHDVMEGLAQITEGRYLPLTEAYLLPEVIIAGAKEEVALQQVENSFLSDIKVMKQNEMSTEDIADQLCHMMSKQKSTAEQITLTDIYKDYDRSNIENITKCSSLEEVRSSIKSLNQPTPIAVTQSVGLKEMIAPAFKIVSRMAKKKMI